MSTRDKPKCGLDFKKVDEQLAQWGFKKKEIKVVLYCLPGSENFAVFPYIEEMKKRFYDPGPDEWTWIYYKGTHGSDDDSDGCYFSSSSDPEDTESDGDDESCYDNNIVHDDNTCGKPLITDLKDRQGANPNLENSAATTTPEAKFKLISGEKTLRGHRSFSSLRVEEKHLSLNNPLRGHHRSFSSLRLDEKAIRGEDCYPKRPTAAKLADFYSKKQITFSKGFNNIEKLIIRQVLVLSRFFPRR